MGKTRSFVKINKRIKESKGDFGSLVVVPTTTLKDQWNKVLQHWEVENVDVKVINTIIQSGIDTDRYRLVCLDEIHKYITGSEFSHIFPIVAPIKFKLGLTATLPELLKKQLPPPWKTVDTITLDEGLKNGWAAHFLQYNYGIDLPSLERGTYMTHYAEFEGYFAYFNHDWTMMEQCKRFDPWMEGKKSFMGARKYCELIREIKIIKETVRNSNAAMAANSAYKDFLYTNLTKVKTTAQIIKHLQFHNPSMKGITFGMYTQTADLLTRMVPNSVSVHGDIESKRVENAILSKYGLLGRGKASGSQKCGSKRLNELSLAMLGNGDINWAHSAKQLVEGTDVAGVQGIITYATDSSVIRQTQKIGRGIRKEDVIDFETGEPIEKESTIVNVYAKGTKDESWLGSAQWGMKRIKHIKSLDEIIL
jgi:superfamily II DNA or RNA helicase